MEYSDSEEEEGPESLIQRFDSLCVSFGEDPVILRGDQDISYIELQEISKILACQIHYRYRPSFVLLDCFGHAVAEAATLTACMRLSVPFVPISTEQQAISLETIVQTLRTSENVSIMAICCVSDDQDLRLGAFYDAGVHSILLVDECGYIREQLAVPDRLPTAIVHSDALYVLFTSGTSGGVPKGVVGSHKSTFRRLAWFRESLTPCQRIARRTSLTFVDGVTELLGVLLEPASVLIALNNPVELIEQGLDAFFANKEESPSQVTLIPSQLEQLFISKSCWKECLERIILSGEPCPEQLYRRTLKELPKCQLLNLYGQTETTGDVLCAILSELDECRAVVNGFVSVGRPILPSIQTKLNSLDENDTKAASFQGELVVSGNMSVGYFSDYVLGEERWTEFHTGDVAFCVDGLWYIKGRKNEVEKMNGVWTSPLDAEIVFEKFYSTRVACTIVRGNLYALVPDENVAQRFSRERMQAETKLPLHLVPHRIYQHEIPLSGVGKIDRTRVKNIIQDFLSENPRGNVTDDVFDSLVAKVLQHSARDQDLSFVEHGGTSATAVRLLYELRRSALNVPDSLNAVDILSVDSLKELKAVVHGIASIKRRKISANNLILTVFQPERPCTLSLKHTSVRFRACVDSSLTISDVDSGCFFMGCQGGVVQRIDIKTGDIQAFHHFSGWMIQSDVVVHENLVLVCGYNRSGQGFIARVSHDLQETLWQKVLGGPVKHTPILLGEVIQVVSGPLVKTFLCASGKELSSIEITQAISSSGVKTPSGDIIYASSDYECSDLLAISQNEQLYPKRIPHCTLGPVYEDLLRVSSQEILIADSWGSVHLISVPTFEAISLHVSESPLSPPQVLIDGTFVVGSYDGIAYCLRKKTDSIRALNELVLEWSVDVGAAVFSKPVAVPGKTSCIVCTTAGHVVQIENGIAKDICRVAGEIWSNPRIVIDESNSILVFGARDSRVHLVKLD